MTDISSPPAANLWDVDELVDKALAVLRFGAADVDAARIRDAATVATQVVDFCVDWSVAAVPSANMVARAVQVTCEEYQRPGVAWGVVNAWSADQIAFRISGDPLAGVREGLMVDKERWGIA